MAPGRMDCSPNSGSIQPHLSRKKVSIRLLDLKWYNSSCRLSDKNKRRAEKHSPILYEPRLPRAEGEALKQFDNKLHQDPQQDHHQDSHQYRDQDPHQDLQEDADLAKNSGSSRMRLLKFSTSAITPLLDLARSIWDRNTERQFKICQKTDQKHLIVLLQQMSCAGQNLKKFPGTVWTHILARFYRGLIPE